MRYLEERLLEACETGDLLTVKTLLRKRPDVNIVDSTGMTPLLLAVKSNNIELINQLLIKGADVSFGDRMKHTPLHYAVQAKQQQICRLLLQNGASVAAVNDDGHRPIHLTHVNSEIWKLLHNAQEQGFVIDPEESIIESTDPKSLPFSSILKYAGLTLEMKAKLAEKKKPKKKKRKFKK